MLLRRSDILSSCLLLSAFATLATLAACGGDDGGGDGDITPTGEHYKYVVDGAKVPTNSTESTTLGMDLDGDGRVDNQLGTILTVLASTGFNATNAVRDSINDGTILLLADIQTPSFTESAGTGLEIHLGNSGTIMPAPCTSAEPPVCGQHLTGTGRFTIAADSPPGAKVVGAIAGGVFKGGPGKLTMQIALAGGQAFRINLIGARAELSNISADKVMTGKVAGAIPKSEFDGMIVPGVATQVNGIVQASCPAPRNPPMCGCAAGSGGATIINLLDTGPKDCNITAAEILSNPTLQTFLNADVMIDGTPALSVGLGVTAAKATF